MAMEIYKLSMELQKLGKKLIHTFIRYVFYLVQIVIWIRTFYAPFTKSKPLPPICNELLLISATEIANRIRKRKVKCINVIEAYIERIQEVNPILNCVVQERFDIAREEAALVDSMLEKQTDVNYWKTKKPLLGVPITVKETIGVEGMSNNAARSRVEFNTAKKDAVCVALLRQAGAIPIVVTNTPELCLYWETFNPRFGVTRNPYDTRRTPGGSSGGEGALLGAAASVVGLGSDMAGSIRLPAMFCGVFGHKPTPGFIAIEGHLPCASDPEWDTYFTLGPLVRYADDISIIVKNMIPTERKPELLRLDEPVDISKLKIFYMFGEGPNAIFHDKITDEVRDVIVKAADYLHKEYNAQSSKIEISGMEDSMVLGCLPFRMPVENVFQSNEDPESWTIWDVLYQLFRKITFQSTSSWTSLSYGPEKIMVDLMPEDTLQKAISKKEQLRHKFNELLGENAVLLYPSFPWAAPYHTRMAYQLLNSAFMILFTLIGLPVTQCPIGFDKNGLPLGIQIVGGQRQDRLCIAVAKALEEGFGGWRPPKFHL